MSRREKEPKRRAHLDQQREEEHERALDFRRRHAENTRQHGRLIIGLPARALLFELAGSAL